MTPKRTLIFVPPSKSTRRAFLALLPTLRAAPWGESCAGYAKNKYVGAESTPSQTAWALLGLHAGGDRASESLRRGLQYLLDTQKRDGTWDESLATGTGFPGVFYLSYHMYRRYFPLMALTVCRTDVG